MKKKKKKEHKILINNEEKEKKNIKFKSIMKKDIKVKNVVIYHMHYHIILY